MPIRKITRTLFYNVAFVNISFAFLMNNNNNAEKIDVRTFRMNAFTNTFYRMTSTYGLVDVLPWC